MPLSSTQTRRYHYLAGFIIAAGVIVCLVAGAIWRDLMFRVNSGLVLERFSVPGFRVGERQNRSVVPIQAQGLALSQKEVDFKLDSKYIWERGPWPYTYGGKLLSECQTLKNVLDAFPTTDAEMSKIWTEVVKRAELRQSISDLIEAELNRAENAVK